MKQASLTRRFYVGALAVRLAAFLSLTGYALAAPEAFLGDMADSSPLLSLPAVCWLALMGTMVFRLFPSRVESLGCQKEFAARFRPTGHAPTPGEIRRADRGAGWVLLLWVTVNVPFFLGYTRGWVDQRFLVCLAGFYGVCDIVCILFFCPFQVWLMRNRCCATCRIYNWDYLMLCTPLLAIHSLRSLSACLLAAVIFLRWEITYRLRRARFFERSNSALRCAACQEQLCRYKHGRKQSL